MSSAKRRKKTNSIKDELHPRQHNVTADNKYRIFNRYCQEKEDLSEFWLYEKIIENIMPDSLKLGRFIIKRYIVFALSIFLVAFIFNGCTEKDEFPVLKGLYLGQKPPGKNAELFAPELIKYEVHESPFISQDEKEIIIGSMTEGTKYYKMIDRVWSLQAVLPFAIPENCNGMFVSPSGK